MAATSSGLGSSPMHCNRCSTPSRHHLELQDRRDYTPADKSSQDMLVRLSRAPVLSGGLRRKNSAFSGTISVHGRFLQDPTSPVQGPQKFKTPRQVPVFPGEQSVVSSYQ
ncbi:hypothetical protein TNCV_2717161 [Trichonephila clavipes]|nr:hypothetical protein TNCV_2717161 [Trichonephila clavipes]